ncbi:MAG: glycogen synthase [Anaerolineae bacterium]|nr:glycogen synthase [Anaerolineae bacterium]
MHTAPVPRVLIAAAECRGLAKVGGLADVVRDLSQALRALGVPAEVAMPYYDAVHCDARPIDRFLVHFGGQEWQTDVFEYTLGAVTTYLLRNDHFFGGAYGSVYIDSDRLGRGPFEDDTQRFAFFSAAALEFLRRHPVDALHCHDWHTGPLLTLLAHDPRYLQLAQSLRTLFTIHNLDYQGTRPFEWPGAERSLVAFADWFPELYPRLKQRGALEPLRDPRAADACFNPLRAGINLAHGVTTVSPTYAREITRPDDPARNFVGGRGLEPDLQALDRRGALHGILNGLDYVEHDPLHLDPPFDVDAAGWQEMRRLHKDRLLEELPARMAHLRNVHPGHFWNAERVLEKLSAYTAAAWQARPLVVSVTRAVGQKVSILLEALDDGTPLLEALLARNISLLVLGTGDLQEQLERINAYDNGLFVCAFDAKFAQTLYAGGDLFLMPSDFEPCGLSQMMAMRYGCLPLVYDIGGLKDTVADMQTGFVYAGANRPEARRALLAALDRALDGYANRPTQWRAIQSAAMRARFEWEASARQYLELYR